MMQLKSVKSRTRRRSHKKPKSRNYDCYQNGKKKIGGRLHKGSIYLFLSIRTSIITATVIKTNTTQTNSSTTLFPNATPSVFE